jgi:hypothetical protein
MVSIDHQLATHVVLDTMHMYEAVCDIHFSALVPAQVVSITSAVSLVDRLLRTTTYILRTAYCVGVTISGYVWQHTEQVFSTQ